MGGGGVRDSERAARTLPVIFVGTVCGFPILFPQYPRRTGTMFSLAEMMAPRMAVATSFAHLTPSPTWPLKSPTTTNACGGPNVISADGYRRRSFCARRAHITQDCTKARSRRRKSRQCEAPSSWKPYTSARRPLLMSRMLQARICSWLARRAGVP
jgi:hypothetical protein